VKIRLLSVGKPREAVLSRLHDRYAARLVRLGVRYETDHVSDVPAGRRYAAEHALEREARSLFERIRPGETVIALDDEGQSLTSQGLADLIERWATPRATLIVGGPLGLHSSVLARADLDRRATLPGRQHPARTPVSQVTRSGRLDGPRGLD
jgi:23S rRNA (pseudouridine1915-N3)-methyltransferase